MCRHSKIHNEQVTIQITLCFTITSSEKNSHEKNYFAFSNYLPKHYTCMLCHSTFVHELVHLSTRQYKIKCSKYMYTHIANVYIKYDHSEQVMTCVVLWLKIFQVSETLQHVKVNRFEYYIYMNTQFSSQFCGASIIYETLHHCSMSENQTLVLKDINIHRICIELWLLKSTRFPLKYSVEQTEKS